MFWCTLTKFFKFQLVGLVQVNPARACAFNALFPSFFLSSVQKLLGEWAEKMQPVDLGASLSRGAWTDQSRWREGVKSQDCAGWWGGDSVPRSPEKCHRVKLVQTLEFYLGGITHRSPRLKVPRSLWNHEEVQSQKGKLFKSLVS